MQAHEVAVATIVADPLRVEESNERAFHASAAQGSNKGDRDGNTPRSYQN